MNGFWSSRLDLSNKELFQILGWISALTLLGNGVEDITVRMLLGLN
jgi:hypothetical protein